MRKKTGKCKYIKNENFYPQKPLWNKNISQKFRSDTTLTKDYYAVYIKNSD